MAFARKFANYNAPRPGADLLQLTLPPACAGQRLDQALANLLPQFSRSRLALWIRDRHVALDGNPALPKDRVWGGEKVVICPVADPAATVAAAEHIALDIVHEDAAVLVVAKP